MELADHLLGLIGVSQGGAVGIEELATDSNPSLHYMRMQPHLKGPGSEVGREIFAKRTGIYAPDVRLFDVINDSPLGVFEIHYDDNSGFQFYAGAREEEYFNEIGRSFTAAYPEARFVEADPPTIVGGHSGYFAGGVCGLSRDLRYPVQTAYTFDSDAHGGSKGNQSTGTDDLVDVTRQARNPRRDPYAALCDRIRNPSKVPGISDYRVVVQVLFKSANEDWCRDRPFGRDVVNRSETMQNRSRLGAKNDRPSDRRKAASIYVGHQENDPGYLVEIRVGVTAPTEEGAIELNNYIGRDAVPAVLDNKITEQTVEFNPFPQRQLDTFWSDMRQREVEWPVVSRALAKCPVFQHRELGTLCHLPAGLSEIEEINWVRSQSETNIPKQVPSFEDFAAQPDRVYPPSDPLIRDEDIQIEAGKRIESTAILPSGEQGTVAGPDARARIDNAIDTPEQPIWLGYGTRDLRDVPLARHSLRRHMGVFGSTGVGKSTFLNTLGLQIARAGRGLMMIDPSGDDSLSFLQSLSPDRLEDVHIIDPTAARTGVAGLNFIDVGPSPEDTEFAPAIEMVVDAVQQIFGLDMQEVDGVMRHIRTLIRLFNESQNNYSLVDLNNAILYDEARVVLREELKTEGLDATEALNYFSHLDEATTRSLGRRFHQVLSMPYVRRLLATRESSINVGDLMAEGDILIVRLGGESEEATELIGDILFRRVWATAQSRVEKPESERTPFQLIADEVDNLVRDPDLVKTMLDESRSTKLGLTLATQDPTELSETVFKSVWTNCNSIISFGLGGATQSKAVADQLGVPWEKLRDEVPYQAWTRVALPNDEVMSDPFQIRMAPPYPPLRDYQTVRDFVTERVYQEGLSFPEDVPQTKMMVRVTGGITDLLLKDHDSEGLMTPLDIKQSVSEYRGQNVKQDDTKSPLGGD